MPNMNWMIKYRNAAEMHGHGIERFVASKSTRFQHVEIVDTYNYGRVLILDGVPQSSQVDEFIYHETLVHPALCAHSEPKEVLIIGAGEGAALREVLRHSTVQRVTMVDIDEELVEMCKEHLGPWHRGAFEDPRTTLCFEDGRSYLDRHRGCFDCVILDLSDPFDGSPARGLFSVEFYSLVSGSLRESGVVAVQAENAALGHNMGHCRIVKSLELVFPRVFTCYAHIPIYATLFGFAVCGGRGLTRELLTTQQIDDVLLQRGVRDLLFYDAETAKGLFARPRFIRRNLAGPDIEVITDANPLQIKA